MPKVKNKKERKPTQSKALGRARQTAKLSAGGKPVIKKRVKYFEGLGRRKTSTARVRLLPQKRKEKIFLVNGKPLENYFPIFELRETVLSPLKLMDCLAEFNVSVKVKGGGVNSQAEAVRNGIAKALVLFNPDFRKKLKKAGYLTRDSRMRERKKFGLKRARRAPQWQKR